MPQHGPKGNPHGRKMPPKKMPTRKMPTKQMKKVMRREHPRGY